MLENEEDRINSITDCPPPYHYGKFIDVSQVCLELKTLLTTYYNECSGPHLKYLENVDPEILEVCKNISFGVGRSIDAVIVLAKSDMGTDAAAISRRIWEYRLNLCFIALNPGKWSFYYNHYAAINAIIKFLKFQELYEKTGDRELEQLAEASSNNSIIFAGVKAKFKSRGFEFPDELSQLKKQFGNSWCQLDRRRMIKEICNKVGEDIPVCKGLMKSYAVDYSATSDLVHGGGMYFQLAKRDHNQGNPDDSMVKTALISTCNHSLNCVEVLIELLDIPSIPILRTKLVPLQGEVKMVISKHYDK